MDIAHEYLGTGYDLCGEYADGVSVKKRLFDLSKVPEKDLRQIPNTKNDYFIIEGESAQEFQSKLTAKVGISGGYMLFSGSMEASFAKSDMSISETGFVNIRLFMRYETWKLQVRDKMYVFPDVIQDFNTKDGKWLIEQYGAAVVMGIDIGGKWSDNMSVSKLFSNSTSDVAASMGVAYGSIVSGKGSMELAKAISSEKSIVNRRVNVTGGDPKYAPSKLEEWQASVEHKPAFMDFTKDGLVPIWDIFPEHMEKLKKGFDEYSHEHQLDIKVKKLIQCSVTEGYQYTTDARSKARKDLHLYKPQVAKSYKYVGVNGNDNKVLLVKEISENYGAVCKPKGWHPIWNDRGSLNGKNYSCWLPKAPPEYVALGVYCRFGAPNQDPPTDEETEGMVVVNKSLVKEAGIVSDLVWSDAGTWAHNSIKLGRLPHHALWPFKTTDKRAGDLPSTYTFKDKYMS